MLDQHLLSNEIEIMCKARGHPNIVQLIDTFEDAKYFYLVMERLEGPDLCELV